MTLALAVQLAVSLAVPLQATAASPALGRTPAGALTVITANVEEYLSVADNNDGRDLGNFARRVKQVLTDLRGRGTVVYRPDVIFLQEVNQATAQRVRSYLSSVLGVTYAIAGSAGYQAAAGRGAHVSLRTKTRPLVTRATSVLYNTATMNAPTAQRMITFSYPKNQMYTSAQCPHPTGSCQANVWEARQSAIFRITAKATGAAYAVASVHFEPYFFLHPTLTASQQPGSREGQWLTALHAAMSRYYPGVTQVFGGDFNERLCTNYPLAYGSAGCDSPGEYTPMTQAALAAGLQPVIDTDIDHLFTSARVIGSGTDTTYQLPAAQSGTYGPVVSVPGQYLDAQDWATRFTTTSAFGLCEAAYNLAEEGRSWARALQGCSTRFYSDHPFAWAVLA